jgi:hypothetical protein
MTPCLATQEVPLSHWGSAAHRESNPSREANHWGGGVLALETQDRTPVGRDSLTFGGLAKRKQGEAKRRARARTKSPLPAQDFS